MLSIENNIADEPANIVNPLKVKSGKHQYNLSLKHETLFKSNLWSSLF